MSKVCRNCNKTYEDSLGFCSSCGAPLVDVEDNQAVTVVTDEAIHSNAPADAIVLKSSAPIPSKCGWTTWGYIAGLILCAFAGVGILVLLLVFVINHFQMTYHRDKMRRMKFKFVSNVSSDDIYNKLQPVLVQKYGSAITFDREGDTLTVGYDGLMYDINVGEDDTFSVWWRKSIVGAIFSFNEWKLYKKVRTGTAIVAYEIQSVFHINKSC